MKKYVVSGVLGFAISLGCILPPLIHFVTGPLGPFIGGFVGGMRARAKLEGAAVIGLVMGTCLGAVAMLAGSLLLKYQVSLPGAMGNVINSGSLNYASIFKIAFIPFGIATVLGTTGAFVGGKVINKEAEKAKG